MPESWKKANERMSCLDCGESGAEPYVTTKGKNPGRNVRVCHKCVHRWEEFGLKPREPVYEEPRAPTPQRTAGSGPR